MTKIQVSKVSVMLATMETTLSSVSSADAGGELKSALESSSACTRLRGS